MLDPSAVGRGQDPFPVEHAAAHLGWCHLDLVIHLVAASDVLDVQQLGPAVEALEENMRVEACRAYPPEI